MIKVIFIDNHAIDRAALRDLLLQEEREIQIIGEASTGQECTELIHLLPDIVILDFMLPDMSGLELIQHLAHANSNIKILVLSSITQDLPIFDMFKAGAWGYLPKNTQKTALIRAIKTLSAGYRMIPPTVAARFALSKMHFI